MATFVSGPWRVLVSAAGVLLGAFALTGCPGMRPPEVEALTIEGGNRTLPVGASEALSAAVTPAGANTALAWTSDDPDVATVVGTGNTATVSAVSPGVAIVEAASSADASKRDAIVVTVVPPAEVVWTVQYGTEAYDTARAVTVDPLGRIVVAGWTGGSLEGTTAGDYDAYVRVYDPDGQHAWTRQFGTVTPDGATAIAAGPDGTLVVAGYTFGETLGSGILYPDVMVSKYEANGDPVWARRFGTSVTDSASGVALDAQGNVYVSGSTDGDLAGPNAGSFDAFLRKYDAAGDHVWTRQFGTEAEDHATGVVVDGDGRVVVVGYTAGSLAGPSVGDVDAFVRVYDPAGDVVWTRQFGTAGDDVAGGVAVDSAGSSILVAGFTAGTLAGSGTGSRDAFVRKYDGEGNHVWTDQFGTTDFERLYGVAVNGSDYVLVTGYTHGDLEGAGAGESDVVVRKYFPDGTELWTRQFGTSGEDGGWAVAVGAADTVVVVGYTHGALHGDPSGSGDAFLRVFGP